MPPLTAFLIDLLFGRLGTTEPAKLAARYGVAREHVVGYLRMLGDGR